MSGYLAAHDSAAFDRAAAEAVVTGQCTTFDEGEAVFVVDSAGALGTMVKIRQRGQTVEYWTTRAAVHVYK